MAFVSAAACQGAISAARAETPPPSTETPPPTGETYTGLNSATAETYSASGWVIFLSFWVMVYQGLAILQLFLHIKLAYTTVPHINWSVFFLVVRLS